ncbi:7843_t:CDS:2 [Racocetra fulgida]|uniref:7843_t:CDS:1 n=1 Tax=Racocetra fulgida TaxID=60492 RepID=A0A9N9AJ03_9GLOM|nr:7843_t:CDS:2 [Racocetra fulgida]
MGNNVSINTNAEVLELNTNEIVEKINSTDEEIDSELILNKSDCMPVINKWFIELDNEIYETDYSLDNEL